VGLANITNIPWRLALSFLITHFDSRRIRGLYHQVALLHKEHVPVSWLISSTEYESTVQAMPYSKDESPIKFWFTDAYQGMTPKTALDAVKEAWLQGFRAGLRYPPQSLCHCYGQAQMNELNEPCPIHQYAQLKRAFCTWIKLIMPSYS
jgi:hypothetical protein